MHSGKMLSSNRGKASSACSEGTGADCCMSGIAIVIAARCSWRWLPKRYFRSLQHKTKKITPPMTKIASKKKPTNALALKAGNNNNTLKNAKRFKD